MSNKYLPITSTTIESTHQLQQGEPGLVGSCDKNQKIIKIIGQLNNRKRQILKLKSPDAATLNINIQNKKQMSNLKSLRSREMQAHKDDEDISIDPQINGKQCKLKCIQSKVKKTIQAICQLNSEITQNTDEMIKVVTSNQQLQIQLKLEANTFFRSLNTLHYLDVRGEPETVPEFNQKKLLMQLLEIEFMISNPRLKPRKILCNFYLKKGLFGTDNVTMGWGLRSIAEKGLVNQLYGELISSREFRGGQRESGQKSMEVQNDGTNKDHELWMKYLRILKVYEKAVWNEQNSLVSPRQQNSPESPRQQNSPESPHQQLSSLICLKTAIKNNQQQITAYNLKIQGLKQQLEFKQEYLSGLNLKIKQKQASSSHIKNLYSQTHELKSINEAIKYFQLKLTGTGPLPQKPQLKKKTTNQLLRSYIKSKKINDDIGSLTLNQNTNKSQREILTSPSSQSFLIRESESIKKLESLKSPKNQNYLAVYRSKSNKKLQKQKIWK